MPQAIRHFDSALGLRPDYFWARYFLSLSYLRLKPPLPDPAKAHLTNCIIQQPRFIWLYLMRGFARTLLGEFEAAEQDFQTAEQLEPTPEARHVLYANRGFLWFQQRNYPEAIAELRRAIDLKPKKYQARVSLAKFYQTQKRWDEAKEQLDRAIQLEPGLAILFRFRAQLRLDRPDQDLEALPVLGASTVGLLDSALGQGPLLAASALMLGRTNLDAALADYREAIQLDAATGDREILAKDYAEQGRIFYRGQRYQEAVKAYAKASKADNTYANAHLWSAQAQSQLQNYPEAGESLDQYVNQYVKRGGRPAVEVYRLRASPGLSCASIGRRSRTTRRRWPCSQTIPRRRPHAAGRTWLRDPTS